MDPQTNRFSILDTRTASNEPLSAHRRFSKALPSEQMQSEVVSIKECIPSLNDENVMRMLFELADLDKNGTLSREEVIIIVGCMNLPYSNYEISKLFDAFDVDKSDTLNFDQYRNFTFLLLTKLILILQTGETFIKVDKGRCSSQIFLQLDTSCRFIEYTVTGGGCCLPSTPTIQRLPIKYLVKIGRGQILQNKKDKNKTLILKFFDKSTQKSQSLNLIAPTKVVCKTWGFLEVLLGGLQINQEGTSLTTRYLHYMFDSADEDNSGVISREEVKLLMAKMSMNISEADVEATFAKMDVDNSGQLDRDEFKAFVLDVSKRLDLVVLWNLLTTDNAPEYTPINHSELSDLLAFKTMPMPNNTALSVTRFKEFWLHEQGTAVDNELKTATFPSETITFDEFLVLLTGIENQVYSSNVLGLTQDMAQPLSHYFISSSHNTYLTGDQLASISSVERYVDDMLDGVRCVELDTWDGPDGEPIITHGHTLCSTISFEEVVQAIQQYGFQTSKYPIILSIENHCSKEQKARMTDIFKSVLGEMLVGADDIYNQPNIALRSPEALKCKVLIKGKRQAVIEHDSDEESDEEGWSDQRLNAKYKFYPVEDETEEETSAEVATTSETSPVDEPVDDALKRTVSGKSDGPPSTTSLVVPKRSGSTSDAPKRSGSTLDAPKRSGSTLDAPKRSGSTLEAPHRPGSVGGVEGAEECPTLNNGMPDKRVSFKLFGGDEDKPKVVKEKMSKITYLAAHHVTYFDNWTHSDHIGSYRESKVTKLIEDDDNFHMWREYNKLHLSRLYPNGVRIDSSNYNPYIGWVAGAQLVALNTQTHGIPRMLNQGLFRVNGHCGYILKPAFMLDLRKDALPALTLRVHVISGQHLPKLDVTDALSPRLEVSLHGVNAQRKMVTKEFKTATIRQNGFDPIWNQVFEFDVEFPELAQLCFRCSHDTSLGAQGVFIAGVSLPIIYLRTGFRMIQLFDESGRKSSGDSGFASVFAHLSIVSTQV